MTIQQITDALQKNAPEGFYIKYVRTYDASDKTGEKITVKDIEFLPPFYEYVLGKGGNDIALAVAATDKNIYVQEKNRSGFDLLSTIKPDKAFFKKLYIIWSDTYLNFTEKIRAEILASAPNGFSVEIQNISGDNTDKLDTFVEKIDVDSKWQKTPPAGVATLKQKFSGLSHDFGFYRDGTNTTQILFRKGLFKTGEMELKKGLKALSELIDPSLTSTKAKPASGGGGRVTTQYYTQGEQEKIQKAVSESTPENVQIVFKGGRTAQAVRIYPLAGSLKGRKAFNNRLEFGEVRPKFANDNINQVAKSFAEDVARFVKRTPTDAEYLANPEILKRGTANKEFRVKKTLDAVRKQKRESNKKSVARGKERGKGDGANSPTRASGEIDEANLIAAKYLPIYNYIHNKEYAADRVMNKRQVAAINSYQNYLRAEISEMRKTRINPTKQEDIQEYRDNKALGYTPAQFSRLQFFLESEREVADFNFLMIQQLKKTAKGQIKNVLAKGRAKRAENAANDLPEPETMPTESERMTRRKLVKAGQADKRTDIKNILAKGRAKRAANRAESADNTEMIETPAKVAKAQKARISGLVRGAYKESIKRIMQKIRTREKAITILQNEIKQLS